MHYLVGIIVCFTVSEVQSQFYVNSSSTADPLYGYFAAAAGADQQIDATELNRVLTTSGISGTYKPFKGSGRLIIMLDRDFNGKMGYNEFKEMWGAVDQWKSTFMQYDRDRSGTIEPHELQAALTSFGYRLSPQALGSIIKAAAENGRITFDNFVGLSIGLRSLTEQFKRRDVSQTGKATFQYDDFIQVVFYAMPLN